MSRLNYAEFDPSETRPASPGQGLALARLPYVQTILRHPQVEQLISRRRDVEERHQLDPVTEGPLSHSLAPSFFSNLAGSSIGQAVCLTQELKFTLQTTPGDGTFDLLNDIINGPFPGIADRRDSASLHWGPDDNEFLAGAAMDPWSSSDFELWNALVPAVAQPFADAQLQDNGVASNDASEE